MCVKIKKTWSWRLVYWIGIDQWIAERVQCSEDDYSDGWSVFKWLGEVEKPDHTTLEDKL